MPENTTNAIDNSTTTENSTVTRSSSAIDEPKNPGGRVLIERVIWFITGVILVLLGIRFLLSLLGANIGNGFAEFIYATSHNFVTPFFSLFSYTDRYGVSHFETYTLIAMVIYGLIAWGLVRLVTLTQHSVSPSAS